MSNGVFYSDLGIALTADSSSGIVAGLGTSGDAIGLLIPFTDLRNLARTVKCVARVRCIVFASLSIDTAQNGLVEPAAASEAKWLSQYRREHENQAKLLRQLRRYLPGIPFLVRHIKQLQVDINGSRLELHLSHLFSIPRELWTSLLDASLCAEAARTYAQRFTAQV